MGNCLTKRFREFIYLGSKAEVMSKFCIGCAMMDAMLNMSRSYALSAAYVAVFSGLKWMWGTIRSPLKEHRAFMAHMSHLWPCLYRYVVVSTIGL